MLYEILRIGCIVIGAALMFLPVLYALIMYIWDIIKDLRGK